MPQGKVLPKDEILTMMKNGMSNIEIMDVLRGQGYSPTGAAVRMIRNRANLPRQTLDHSALIPWRVPNRDQQLYIPQMLRLESRRRQARQGLCDPLSPEEEEAVDRWLMRLTMANQVVIYEGEWKCVPRRPSDKDIIRRPEDM